MSTNYPFYKSSRLVTRACWWSIIIILTWTSVLKGFTLLSNLSLFILYFINWNNFSSKDKKLSIIFIMCTFALFAYSLICGNEIHNITRFSLILIFIALSYFVVLPLDLVNKSLSITALTLCIALILGEIYFLMLFDKVKLPSLRYYLNSSQIGDIYPKYGNFYAIQLVGTAAIPFVFMYSFVSDLFKRHKWSKRIILLFGIIIAGNFGYIIAISIYIVIKFYQDRLKLNVWFNRFCIALVIIICVTPVAYKFIKTTLEEKKEVSNAIRMEQADILICSMCENPITSIFGNGLGTRIEARGKFRDYSQSQYFELQSLYFLNQMGIIPFILFIGWNLYFSLKNIRYPKLLLVYLCYVIYAITNPYIFNTNQIVVIISLVSLAHYKSINKISNTYTHHDNFSNRNRCIVQT